MQASWRTRWIWAAGVISAAALILVLRPRDASAHSAELSGTFEQEIVRVIPSAGGRVREVLAKEGDSVRAGDLLLRLDDGGMRSRYEQARAAADRAKSQLKAGAFLSDLPPEVVGRLLSAHPDVQRTERAYVAARKEADQAGPGDAGAARKLAEAAEARDVVRERVARQWNSAFHPGTDPSSEIDHELDALADELAAFDVTAPVAGTVEILQLQPGDLVVPGLPAASVAKAGSFYVDVYASVDELGLAKEGAAVRVRIGGAGEARGIIQHVARTATDFSLLPAADSDQGRLFAIHVKLDTPPAAARPGMPATVLLNDVGPGPVTKDQGGD